MQWEIAKGPVTIRNCSFSGNRRGFQLETGHDFTFDTCTFENNRDGAFYLTWKVRDKLRGDPDTYGNGGPGNLNQDPGNNWTYAQALIGTKRTTFKGCTFKTNQGANSLFFRKRPEDTSWADYKTWVQDEFVGTTNAAGKANEYYNSASANAFQIANASSSGSLLTDLCGWRSATGSDSGATRDSVGAACGVGATIKVEAYDPPVEKFSSNGGSDVHRTFSDGAASGSICAMFEANATGDSVSYDVTGVQLVKYDIYVQFKKGPDRGKCQVSIAGVSGGVAGSFTNHGLENDLFNTVTSFNRIKITQLPFASAGTKRFKFTSTGQNGSASGKFIPIDYIELVPVP
jgi:hypothetical protein